MGDVGVASELWSAHVGHGSCEETKTVCTYCPEVVHQNVENTQDHHEHNGAPLRLESHDHHDAGYETDDNDYHTTEAPFASKHKSNEQENEKYSASQLKVHFSVLLIQCGQPCWGKLLPNPAVGQHHYEAAHDRQVAQEEVDVEDQPIPEGLCDYNANETTNGIFGVFASDDEDGGDGHGENIDQEEQVVDAPRHCRRLLSARLPHRCCACSVAGADSL